MSTDEPEEPNGCWTEAASVKNIKVSTKFVGTIDCKKRSIEMPGSNLLKISLSSWRFWKLKFTVCASPCHKRMKNTQNSKKYIEYISLCMVYYTVLQWFCCPWYKIDFEYICAYSSWNYQWFCKICSRFFLIFISILQYKNHKTCNQITYVLYLLCQFCFKNF